MTVGVVGLGLIGGSIGLALRDPSRRVVGFDPEPAHVKLAITRGCVDEAVSFNDACQADVVFVACPPDQTAKVVLNVLEALRDDAIVTDCASVKERILEEVQAGAPKDGRFVGGHPMAGHEKTGPGFASGWLFRGARWILTPQKWTPKKGVGEVEKLVKAMGAVPIRVDAAEHDRHVAIVSHLPHVMAAALVTLGETIERPEATGGSWRDLTRVAGADPDLWTQILMGNPRQVSAVLGEYAEHLARVRTAVAEGDTAAVRSFFERAKLAKSRYEA